MKILKINSIDTALDKLNEEQEEKIRFLINGYEKIITGKVFNKKYGNYYSKSTHLI